ncbi:penicillin-binding protein activator [Marinobacter koreensis]|uniref:Penicillin-binding protein activator n=1 Tax=Marinobacter koreensis TaxID=335974 RepID=A0ABW0RM79_9GAMM|nr:penicillin-binding protein activator [Marinobacter koreensis]MCK7549130.1 penicillin-binding protein activator [Marinobacter koreensis]
MIKKSINQSAVASVLLFVLALSGCATVNLQSRVAQTADEAINLASQEDNRDTAVRFLLKSANHLQKQGNHTGARTILQSQQLSQLSPELEQQRQLLAMDSAVALDDRPWAQTLAGQLSPESFTGYSAELLSRAANLQAKTFELAGKPLDAALTLILLTQADATADIQTLHDRIWQLLKKVPDQALDEANAKSIGYESQGWLELAALLRSPGANLDEQGRIVRRWQNNWPGHPAAQVLPSELQLIATLATSRPEKIALALPLDGDLGNAGRAIRDGFLSAFYLDQSVDRSKTEIRIFNTAKQSFSQLYQDLSSKDFDLIVGPLEKSALSSLSALHTLPVPVLGLNYLPEDAKAPEGLYQFGLSAEDEARQIADQLAAKGLNQVLALIPQGDWGDRVEKALLNRLSKNDATALDVERFFPEDNLRAVTAALLGINASRDRAIQVERTIGLNVEFEPRRRQDADAIVMVALPTIARQFKPLFAFYYGGDLPVYSPSIVYEGTPDPTRDRDLNDVTFTDIPWVLDDNDEFRDQATRYLKGTRGQLGRLFAMGADAWQLGKRLPLLRQVDDAAIQGQTGTLTMNRQGSIQREQLWAQFKNGVPVVLSEPETGSDEQPAGDGQPNDVTRGVTGESTP